MDEDERVKQRLSIYQDNAKTALVMSGEYARWVISTLFLMHSAMIAAVVHEKELNAPPWTIFIFGFGVLLALLGAYSAFFNLQGATQHYRTAAEALAEGNTPPPVPRKIVIARAWAIRLVSGSGVILIVGAAFVAGKFARLV